ncbi:MAG: PH domain-containing protein [Phycisphaerae bacterium]|nr:PH domain-containing protein [Phycisphaerae bacterium]
MTMHLEPSRRGREATVPGTEAAGLKSVPNAEQVHWSEGPSGGVVGLAVPEVVPAHLLDGGEVVHFAIKPSPWFVLLVSLKWVALGIALVLLAGGEFVPPSSRWYVYQVAMWLTGARLAWATLEWVSRLYVLTNRRVIRIRGVFNVDLYECALDRIQSTSATLALPERCLRVGTITFQTAGGGGGLAGAASWRIVSRPLEIHEQLREAIRRAQNRGANGL